MMNEEILTDRMNRLARDVQRLQQRSNQLEKQAEDITQYNFANQRINKLESEVERLAELCLRMFDHLEKHRHRTDFEGEVKLLNITSNPIFEPQEELKLQIDRVTDPTEQTLSERKTDGSKEEEGQPQGDQGSR